MPPRDWIDDAELCRVLRLLPATTGQVAEVRGITNQAANRRLERALELGLAGREKKTGQGTHGKGTWLYRVTQAGEAFLADRPRRS